MKELHPRSHPKLAFHCSDDCSWHLGLFLGPASSRPLSGNCFSTFARTANHKHRDQPSPGRHLKFQWQTLCARLRSEIEIVLFREGREYFPKPSDPDCYFCGSVCVCQRLWSLWRNWVISTKSFPIATNSEMYSLLLTWLGPIGQLSVARLEILLLRWKFQHKWRNCNWFNFEVNHCAESKRLLINRFARTPRILVNFGKWGVIQ